MFDINGKPVTHVAVAQVTRNHSSTTSASTGTDGGDKLTRTTFIQRVNTVGGVAPSADCVAPTDIGKQAFVPYRADYFFYKAVGKPDGNQ